jgi:hypothetical protein
VPKVEIEIKDEYTTPVGAYFKKELQDFNNV